MGGKKMGTSSNGVKFGKMSQCSRTKLRYYYNVLIRGNMIQFCRDTYHCPNSIPKQYTWPRSTLTYQYNMENAKLPVLTYPIMAGTDPSGLVSSRVIAIGASSSSMSMQPQ